MFIAVLEQKKKMHPKNKIKTFHANFPMQTFEVKGEFGKIKCLRVKSINTIVCCCCYHHILLLYFNRYEWNVTVFKNTFIFKQTFIHLLS